jgi:asparagine synthase (glutamine-hydrolysing)
VHTWSVGMPQCNEFDWARLAAEKLNTEHHDVEIEAEEYRATLVEMVKKRREPLSVPNEVLLLLLTRQVKELNTVVLSGEGADELFFGYDRIFRWAASAREWDLTSFDRLYSYGTHDDLDVVEDAISPFYDRGAPLRVVAAFFQVAHLQGLLRRLDNATMLCGVEARTPFVDYRLVERLAGVPLEYRMAEGVVKAPLKRVFADIVPPEIIAREKVGFPVALAATVPPGLPGATPMARWLAWNLELLGLAESADEAMRGAG